MKNRRPSGSIEPSAARRLPSALAAAAGMWREAGLVFMGQAASAAGSLASLKVLTTFLPAAAYGEISLVLVSCTLPALVLLGPVVQSCYRFYAEHAERGTLPVLVGTSIVLQAAAVVAVGLGLGAASWGGLTGRTGIPGPAIAWGFLLFVTDSGRTFCLAIAAAARARAVGAAALAADALLRPLGAVAFVSVFGRESGPALAGFFTAGLLSLVPLAFWLSRRAGRLRLDRKTAAAMMRYGLPYGIWGWFGWAQAGADRYMVDHWLTRADVGRYVAGAQVGAFPFAFAGVLAGQIINPIIFQKAGDGSDPGRMAEARSIIVWAGTILFIFGLFALAGCFFFGLPVLRLLTRRSGYDVPLSTLMLLATGALFFQLAQIGSSLLLAQKKSVLVLWPKILGGVTAVATGALAIPRWGLTGAAVSSLCASAALLGGLWIGPARRAWRPEAPAVPGRKLLEVGYDPGARLVEVSSQKGRSTDE